MKNVYSLIIYRLGQVRQQLGFVEPLSAGEQQAVAECLPAAAYQLFSSMSTADQCHALRVYRGLQQRGCPDEDLLIAALLHDVGKAEGRVPFWTRPVLVIGKRYFRSLLYELTLYPVDSHPLPGWRRALSYAWWHAEVGADLAASAGLSERVVHAIRMHHRPDSPELMELHLVDEVS